LPGGHVKSSARVGYPMDAHAAGVVTVRPRPVAFLNASVRPRAQCRASTLRAIAVSNQSTHRAAFAAGTR
jgi:hypothetical protein